MWRYPEERQFFLPLCTPEVSIGMCGALNLSLLGVDFTHSEVVLLHGLLSTPGEGSNRHPIVAAGLVDREKMNEIMMKQIQEIKELKAAHRAKQRRPLKELPTAGAFLFGVQCVFRRGEQGERCEHFCLARAMFLVQLLGSHEEKVFYFFFRKLWEAWNLVEL